MEVKVETEKEKCDEYGKKSVDSQLSTSDQHSTIIKVEELKNEPEKELKNEPEEEDIDCSQEENKIKIIKKGHASPRRKYLGLSGVEKLLKHMKLGEGINICVICFKEFSQEIDYKRHVMKHTGKNFKCEICFKSFSLLCNLKSHMITHTGIP
ncbi:uncharacterized protein [Diabrotica undecimpunctata]|uniref:uncharacterized protein n=1 Tax=Diabrotica undecimpunctata TaxID=50387 RepID=UPI003B6351BB